MGILTVNTEKMSSAVVSINTLNISINVQCCCWMLLYICLCSASEREELCTSGAHWGRLENCLCWELGRWPFPRCLQTAWIFEVLNAIRFCLKDSPSHTLILHMCPVRSWTWQVGVLGRTLVHQGRFRHLSLCGGIIIADMSLIFSCGLTSFRSFVDKSWQKACADLLGIALLWVSPPIEIPKPILTVGLSRFKTKIRHGPVKLQTFTLFKLSDETLWSLSFKNFLKMTQTSDKGFGTHGHLTHYQYATADTITSSFKLLFFPLSVRYVESKALPLSSVEQAFQSNLVSISMNHTNVQQAIKIHNISSFR